MCQGNLVPLPAQLAHLGQAGGSGGAGRSRQRGLSIGVDDVAYEFGVATVGGANVGGESGAVLQVGGLHAWVEGEEVEHGDCA